MFSLFHTVSNTNADTCVVVFDVLNYLHSNTCTLYTRYQPIFTLIKTHWHVYLYGKRHVKQLRLAIFYLSNIKRNAYSNMIILNKSKQQILACLLNKVSSAVNLRCFFPHLEYVCHIFICNSKEIHKMLDFNKFWMQIKILHGVF